MPLYLLGWHLFHWFRARDIVDTNDEDKGMANGGRSCPESKSEIYSHVLV